jgi:hypothetical protein
MVASGENRHSDWWRKSPQRLVAKIATAPGGSLMGIAVPMIVGKD